MFKAHALNIQTEGKALFYNFVSGAIAGTFGTMLNTPPDVVKTRIQQQDAILQPGQPRKYSWAIPSMMLVAKEEGYLRPPFTFSPNNNNSKQYGSSLQRIRSQSSSAWSWRRHPTCCVRLPQQEDEGIQRTKCKRIKQTRFMFHFSESSSEEADLPRVHTNTP